MRSNFIKIALTLCSLCSGLFALAQDGWINGEFPFRNFNVKDIGSSPQILSGTQGLEGKIFVGNNQHILSYDGVSWSKVLVNKNLKKQEYDAVHLSTVQKMLYTSDGQLIIARRTSIGKIVYDDQGKHIYQPFYILKNGKTFNEFIRLIEVNKGQFLAVTKKEILLFTNESPSRIPVPGNNPNLTCTKTIQLNQGILFCFSSKIDQETKNSYALYDTRRNSLQPVLQNTSAETENLLCGFTQGNKEFVWSSSGKLFSISTNNKTLDFNPAPPYFFQEFYGKSVLQMKKWGEYWILNVQGKGLFIADEKGTIIRQFDFSDGLESSAIQKFFLDEEGNLWALLDNGIHFIELSSPISTYSKNRGIKTVIQSILVDQNKVYLGTNDDLFVTNRQDNRIGFIKKPHFNEILFDVCRFESDFGTKYMVVAYNGVFEYFPENGTKKLITPVPAWKIHQYQKDKNVLFVGLVNGLGRIDITKKGLVYSDVMTDLDGDVISLTDKGDRLYFGIYGQGLCAYDPVKKTQSIYRIKKSGHKKSYYIVNVFNGRVIVGCQSGLYELKHDELVPFEECEGVFTNNDNLAIHNIFNDNNERLWIVWNTSSESEGTKKYTGYISNQKDKLTLTRWPFYLIDLSSVANDIQFKSSNETWIGGINGLYVFNREKESEIRKKHELFIDHVYVNNKLFCANPNYAKDFGVFSFEDNTIRFQFHTNSYLGLEKTMYSVKLEGFDDWSEYSESNLVNYQRLYEGKYTLLVRSKNVYGFVNEFRLLNFTISPPWYRSWWAYLIYIGLFVGLVAFVSKLTTKRIVRQNQLLEETVLERTKEIAFQNEQLEHQKSELTRKSNDILDSIKYAKRIQNTILPAEFKLKEFFDDHFVFYRPKDIVSGDFYWAKKMGDEVLFAVVDCTGHGVPGALVSIVGNNGLLRTTNEFQLSEPGEILTKLREVVISSFQSDGKQHVNDGMDMALCSLNTKTNLLKYAGANNECVIIRNGEMIELNPDKQPIGEFINPKPFSQQEIQLEKGDAVYLYSDGIVDQFGGSKGKKFKSRPFKDKLLEIHTISMSAQFNHIQNTFDNWKGDLEQVDDVCVLAIRI